MKARTLIPAAASVTAGTEVAAAPAPSQAGGNAYKDANDVGEWLDGRDDDSLTDYNFTSNYC